MKEESLKDWEPVPELEEAAGWDASTGEDDEVGLVWPEGVGQLHPFLWVEAAQKS